MKVPYVVLSNKSANRLRGKVQHLQQPAAQ